MFRMKQLNCEWTLKGYLSYFCTLTETLYEVEQEVNDI